MAEQQLNMSSEEQQKSKFEIGQITETSTETTEVNKSEPKLKQQISENSSQLINKSLLVKTPIPMKRKNKTNQINSQNTPLIEKECPPKSTIKRKKMDDTVNKIQPVKLVTGKPPIPPKPDKLKVNNNNGVTGGITNKLTGTIVIKNSKKLVDDEQHNVLVQKINALTDKLRLENAELLAALQSERTAVRTLR